MPYSKLTISSLVVVISLYANDYLTKTDVSYLENKTADPYQNERCVVDLYYPKSIKSFASIVWFHGGGLKSGKKAIPELLKEQGMAVIAVNYRLHPNFQNNCLLC